MIKINTKKIKKEILEKELENIKVSKNSENKKSKPMFILNPTDIDSPKEEFEKLMTLYGEEFVKAAYSYVLEREADPEGFKFYLEKLQSGEYSKNDVLVRLRFSKEGRKRKKKIKQLYLKAAYFFLSHLKFIGYPVKLFKNILMLPSIEKKITIHENQYIPLLLKLNHQMIETKEKFYNTENLLIEKIKNMQEEVSYYKDVLLKLNHQLIELQKTKKIPSFLESEPILMREREDDFYKTFEETFRGSKEEVERKQEIYLNYLYKSPFPVLDIGFGRGEFLQLLKKSNIFSMGIDISDEFVKQAKENGLNVYKEDAVKFLEKTDMRFSNITAFHIIEHLDLENQINLIKKAYEKLETGGKLIIETPNPKFIEAFANFYIDPTHKKPLPPETLIFFFEYFGFKNIKLLYLSPISDNIPFKEKEEKYYRDYAVIGEK